MTLGPNDPVRNEVTGCDWRQLKLLNNLVFSDRAVTVVKWGEELIEECSQPKDVENEKKKFE